MAHAWNHLKSHATRGPLIRKFRTDPLLSVCGGVCCSKHLPENPGSKSEASTEELTQ